MPAGKRVCIGVWEDRVFVGVVIFSLSANQWMGNMFGLTMFQICELVRVALTKHITPVSRILAIAIKMIKTNFPGQRLIASYADTEQNHHGGIYAASGWVYTGMVQFGKKGSPSFLIHGRKRHPRSVHALGWKQNINWIREHVDARAYLVYPKGKHKYLFPLDKAMQEQIESLRRPYPKRATSETSDTSSLQDGKGGAAPTVALKEMEGTT